MSVARAVGEPTEGDRRAPGRRRLSSAERRRSILAAARTAFARHGYEATTTRMIAAEAGVTDALIYRHFTSKAALLNALVDELTAEFAAMAGGPSGRAATAAEPTQTLTRLGGRFAEAFDAQLDLIVLLISNPAALADSDRLAVFIHRAALGLASRLDPADPDRGYLLARGFMASIAGLALLQRTLGLDELVRVDQREYVRVLAEAFGAAASGVGPSG